MTDVKQTKHHNDTCYHCGLPNPPLNKQGSLPYSVLLFGEEKAMCCLGCQSVAQAIIDNGLTSFYQHRTETAKQTIDRDISSLIPESLRIYDDENVQKNFVRQLANNETSSSTREASLILEGIVCAACIWLNENHVFKLDGVLSFRVNYSTHRATLRWDNSIISLSHILQAITDIGYLAHPFDTGRLDAIHKQEKSAALKRIAIAGIGMMQVMMLAISLYLGEVSDMTLQTEHFLRWISLILTLPVVFFASNVFFLSAWKDIQKGQLGMDVPVSLAIASAFLASVWATINGSGTVYFDSVNMFTFFLLVGRYLEMNARHSAGRITDALMRLIPDTAIRLDNNKQPKQVSIHDLSLGDHLLIKAGSKIPTDAEIIKGNSAVDESLLTGESLPINKIKGDTIIAGSINIDSALEARVTSLGNDTMLSSIVRLLDKAQTEKPHLAQLADKVASKFVMGLLLLTIIVFSYWAYFSTIEQAFWITLSVLVVTCPCALSLATPTALTIATSVLTRQGLVIAKPHAIETLAEIDHLVFDKTGTLTSGQPCVVKQIKLAHYSMAECHRLVAGLETYSDHPIAFALSQLSDTPHRFSDVSVVLGKGLQGRYEGKNYYVGHAAYIESVTGIHVADQNRGLLTVYLACDDQLLACYQLDDVLRNEVSDTIKSLKKINIKISLLSGDKEPNVAKIAHQLAITDYHFELLPQDKMAYLEGYINQSQAVLMVGDGLNDAPVLAKAHLSIAMGKGTQLAQSAADMVLLSDNIGIIAFAIKMAQKTKRIIRQNIIWAIGYNVVAIPLAVTGMIEPWMAAIGMSISSLVVVMNALRLKE